MTTALSETAARARELDAAAPGRTPFALAAALAVGLAAAAQEPTLPELVRSVDSSVVEIAAVQRSAGNGGLEDRVSAGSLGSGFLISADGRVMTASHVVQVADEVAVRFVSGEVVAARVVASVPSVDVALLEVESVPAGIEPARLGDSDRASVGDQVFVIGAPFGISHTLTVGHVSARRAPQKLFGAFEPVEVLQTDASINQGNSGGPMFNMDGEVIGVVSHILSSSGGFQGLGFAVSSNLAMRVLIDESNPWTGLDGLFLDGHLARALNLPQSAGILVERVAASSPASRLGLRAGTTPARIGDQSLTLGGDIILSVYGVRVGEPDFHRRIREHGQTLDDQGTIALQVLRGGEVVTLEATVGALLAD